MLHIQNLKPHNKGHPKQMQLHSPAAIQQQTAESQKCQVYRQATTGKAHTNKS